MIKLGYVRKFIRINRKKPKFCFSIYLFFFCITILPLKEMRLREYNFVQNHFVRLELEYPGGNIENIIKDINIPLEELLSRIQHVESIESSIENGRTDILIKLFENTNPLLFLLEAYQSLEGNNLHLPSEVRKPRIEFTDPNENPIAILILESNTIDLEELFRIGESEILPELKKGKGIGKITIFGGKTKELTILSKRDHIESLQLEPIQLFKNIQRSQNKTMGLLKKNEDSLSQFIANSEGNSISDFAKFPIHTKNRSYLYLSELANIYWVDAPINKISRRNGSDKVSIFVYSDKQETYSAILHVRNLISRFQHKDMRIENVISDPENFYILFYQFLFYYLSIGFLLPFLYFIIKSDLYKTFNLQRIFHFSINAYLSILLSLALVFGIITSIYSSISYPILRGIFLGSLTLFSKINFRFITFLVLFILPHIGDNDFHSISFLETILSCICIIIIFPFQYLIVRYNPYFHIYKKFRFLMIHSIYKRFVFQIKNSHQWILNIFSWLKNKILRPYFFLKNILTKFLHFWQNIGSKKERFRTIIPRNICILYLLVLSILLLNEIDREYFQLEESPSSLQIKAILEMPVGSTIGYTNSISMGIENRLQNIPFLESTISRIEKERAFLFIQVNKNVPINKNFYKYLELVVGDTSPGYLYFPDTKTKNNTLHIHISGKEYTTLNSIVHTLINKYTKMYNLSGTTLKYKPPGEEIGIQPNFQKILQSGSDIPNFAGNLRMQIQGGIVSKWKNDHHIRDIRFKVFPEIKNSNEMATIPFISQGQKLGKSQAYYEEIMNKLPYRITRRNKLATLSFAFRISDLTYQQIQNLKENLQSEELPEGYFLDLEKDKKTFEKYLLIKFLFSILIIFLFLVFILKMDLEKFLILNLFIFFLLWVLFKWEYHIHNFQISIFYILLAMIFTRLSKEKNKRPAIE